MYPLGRRLQHVYMNPNVSFEITNWSIKNIIPLNEMSCIKQREEMVFIVVVIIRCSFFLSMKILLTISLSDLL
jgi:hypothetical protein